MNNDIIKLKGNNIKIGIIDSGYDLKAGKIQIKEGINLSRNKSDKNIQDFIGHGTAVTSIVHKLAPSAELFCVKVFDNELISTVPVIVRAIKWCFEKELDIINLSLGTPDEKGKKDLELICRTAKEKGIFIVSAASNNGGIHYPSVFSNVFGVAAGKITGLHNYYFNNDNTIQFIARGDRQRLHWLDNKSIFMGGTSFAASHVTGLLALFLNKYENIKFDSLCEKLIEHSVSNPPELVNGSDLYKFDNGSVDNKSKKKIRDVFKRDDLSWIKNVTVFPFNKEMHSLIRYQELLSFNLRHVIDVPGRKTIGRDCGELIGIEPCGIIVKKSIGEALHDIDTIVLGYLDEISRIKKRDVLFDILNLALENNKNIYSLNSIFTKEYSKIVSEFNKKSLFCVSPIVDILDYKSITQEFNSKNRITKPVVGIFGTGSSQGKFTVQLALKKAMQEKGYNIGLLGTEHQSALFGANFTFPNGYNSEHNIKIPSGVHIPFLQSIMVGIERDDPDLIVVGGQSGLIPCSFREYSFLYTISTIQVVFGTEPDVCILVVNHFDEKEYIQDTINVLKVLGKAKTILLVFSDKKKIVTTTFGRTNIHYEKLTKSEIENERKRFQLEFNIPATEIVSDDGCEIMVNTIIDYFKK